MEFELEDDQLSIIYGDNDDSYYIESYELDSSYDFDDDLSENITKLYLRL